MRLAPTARRAIARLALRISQAFSRRDGVFVFLLADLTLGADAGQVRLSRAGQLQRDRRDFDA